MATAEVDQSCTISRISTEEGTSRNNGVLTDRDVNCIVERKVRHSDFSVLDWSMDPLDATNGFLGQYYNVRVTAKVNDATENLRFFAKTPPPFGGQQYEFLFRYDTFNKEVLFYTEMIGRMGRGNGPKWMAECYLWKKDLIVVLEDATVEGYRTPDKYIAFDEDHCVWMVKSLSRFHSRSLILDEKLRRNSGKTILDLYGHLLKEVLYANDERSRKAYFSGISGAYTLIDLAEASRSEEERMLIKDRVGKWGRAIDRLLGSSDKHRNVICHRDVWPNNLMFKHDSTGKPNGCYLVDFQFLRYCPPAIDFCCCLQLTTDRATRDRCYESLQKIYYDTLERSLAEEGLNAEDCLSWAAFRESCIDGKNVALIYAMLNLQIMLLSSEAVEKYFIASADLLEQVLYGDKRSELVRHQYQTIPSYRSRMAETVQEIREHLPDEPNRIVF